MTLQKKITFKKIFFILGISYSIIYILACLTPYINPVNFWPLTFLALGFVYLLAGMLLLFLLSLFIFRKRAWIFLLIILTGFQNISSTFGLHYGNNFFDDKNKNSLRLLSWNSNYFGDCQIKNDSPNSIRRQMFQFIQQSDADVLCFQDFSNFIGTWFFPNVNFIRDSLHYPYVYFPIEYSYNDFIPEQYGPSIFSRFPLSDTGRIKYWGDASTETFQFATILFKGKPIKIFNAHLRSMQIHTPTASPKNYNFLQADSGVLFHPSTFKKLKQFDKIHVEQALIIKSELNKNTVPFIFCGDLNAVPTSYVYRQISNGLSDAFLKTGFGLGGTYDSISPTLRIDVVLLDQHLKTVQQQTPTLHLSDHYPNVVDIQWR